MNRIQLLSLKEKLKKEPTNKATIMIYRFIKDVSTRWYVDIKASSKEKAIEMLSDAEWEQEPDDMVSYHRIEEYKNQTALDECDVLSEDEETEF